MAQVLDSWKQGMDIGSGQHFTGASATALPSYSHFIQELLGPPAVLGQQLPGDRSREDFSLPQGYESCELPWVSRRFVYMILNHNSFMTRVVLPIKYSENPEIHWTVLRFNRSLFEFEPEGGVPRLTQLERTAHHSHMERRGIAIHVNRGFAATPAGQQDWAEKMQAVAAIIQETNDQAGLQALVESSNYYTMMQRNRMGKYPTLLAAFQAVVDMYGIFQFAELGLHKIINQSKDAFMTEGVNPDCIILPANVPSIMSMSDDRNMSAMHAGTEMARYRQDNGGDSYNSFNGLHVFRARPYTLDNDGGTVSPLTHTTQIGKYFVVPCFEPTASASGAVYHVPFKGRTKAYFLASDRWHGINWQEVLQKSGFEDRNDTRLMNILEPSLPMSRAAGCFRSGGAAPMDCGDDDDDAMDLEDEQDMDGYCEWDAGSEDDEDGSPPRDASACAYAQAMARTMHAEHKLPFAANTMVGYCSPHVGQGDHALTNSRLLAMGDGLRSTLMSKMGMSSADLDALHTSPDGSARPVDEVANDMYVFHLRDRSNGLYDHLYRSGMTIADQAAKRMHERNERVANGTEKRHDVAKRAPIKRVKKTPQMEVLAQLQQKFKKQRAAEDNESTSDFEDAVVSPEELVKQQIQDANVLAASLARDARVANRENARRSPDEVAPAPAPAGRAAALKARRAALEAKKSTTAAALVLVKPMQNEHDAATAIARLFRGKKARADRDGPLAAIGDKIADLFRNRRGSPAPHPVASGHHAQATLLAKVMRGFLARAKLAEDAAATTHAAAIVAAAATTATVVPAGGSPAHAAAVAAGTHAAVSATTSLHLAAVSVGAATAAATATVHAAAPNAGHGASAAATKAVDAAEQAAIRAWEAAEVAQAAAKRAWEAADQAVLGAHGGGHNASHAPTDAHIYYDWLVYMPFMEFSTSSVIVCKSGDTLGNTYIGHVDTMMSDETISKMHYAHVTAWTNSVVYDRRQLMIFQDAFVQEYLNGANDTFLNWKLHADEMRSGDPAAVFRRHGASLVAVPVPVGALDLEDKVSNINNPISITGEVPSIFSEYIQPGALDTAHIGTWMHQTQEMQDAINLRRDIAGVSPRIILPVYQPGAGHRISKAASVEFGFARMNSSEAERTADQSYHESNLASNVMLYRASHQLRNPISGQWETNIINSGHFSGCGQYMGALELCNGGFGVAPQEIVRKDPRARILV